MESEILHIPEMAKLMSRSESSIRSAVRDKAGWMPPHFKQGVKLCWRRQSVLKFLAEYEAGMHRPAKIGRPRAVPGSLRPAHAVG